MSEQVLIFEREIRYSDMREQYFMFPNFFYDEGEYIDLSIHARYAFGYMIRKANKQDKENGKQDIIYFSAEELARKSGFSLSTAKKVTKELIEKEWIRKLTIGSNFTGRANTYRIQFPYPVYVDGAEIDVEFVKDDLQQDKIDELLAKGTGKIYYYEEERGYSHRKRLPLLLDQETGVMGLSVLNIEQN